MHVLVRYHEIGLKGKNQSFFLDRLVSNLQRSLSHLPRASIRKEQGQVLVGVPDGVDRAEVIASLSRVFGVAKLAVADRVERDLDALKAGIGAVLERERPSFNSFRITASRADKRYPLTSLDLNRELGDFVNRLTGARVDLHHPDLTVYVDVRERDGYIYLDPLPGPGGLPVGVSGRVVSLLSGGIDSPVAAHRMMRRGCSVAFVHFHSFPLVDGASRDKARQLVATLDRYQGGSRLYLVPFADIQRRIIAAAPPAYRVVAYRRFMVRVAQAIARKEGALALVTGESVGQVASQTLENIASIDAVAEMPILRPLIGMDKAEIIQQAQQIGTYATSIEPDEDCCSLFVPRHPVIHSTVDSAARAEEGLDVPALVQMGVDGAELIETGRAAVARQ
jgi:thiamine biosynthesis protein ThiI